MVNNDTSSSDKENILTKAFNKAKIANNNDKNDNSNDNIFKEAIKIYKEEGFSTLFLGLRQRLLYTGLANGIRLAAYGTSRMDLMMRSLDDI